jgi:hypothetical protein
MIFPQHSAIITSKGFINLKDIIMTEKKRIDYDSYVGKTFGKINIISYFYLKNRIHFLCSCLCGKNMIKQANSVIHGYSKLKGCKTCSNSKHGLFKTPTWNSWSGAKNRCNNTKNKDYIHYGQRGITICERWNSFENFLADMGEKPMGLTLDRIDNNGQYGPENCRWATYSQQNSNQRRRKVKDTI